MYKTYDPLEVSLEEFNKIEHNDATLDALEIKFILMPDSDYADSHYVSINSITRWHNPRSGDYELNMTLGQAGFDKIYINFKTLEELADQEYDSRRNGYCVLINDGFSTLLCPKRYFETLKRFVTYVKNLVDNNEDEFNENLDSEGNFNQVNYIKINTDEVKDISVSVSENRNEAFVSNGICW